MTEPKFTPGPWTFRRVDSEGSLVYCQIGPAAAFDKHRSVAYAGTYGKDATGSTAGIRQTDAECEANARIIAAAPKMYDALKLALEIIGERGGLHTPTGRCRSRIRSVIAEVEGD